MTHCIRTIPLGTRFGKVIVNSEFLLKKRTVKGKERNEVFYKILCDCGNLKEVYGGNLLGSRISSCGCSHIGKKNPKRGLKKIGQQYGKLLVLKIIREDSKGAKIYLCRCECGIEKEIHTSNLKQKGGVQSCGCTQRVFYRTLNVEKFLTAIGKSYSRYANGRAGRPYRSKVYELTLDDLKDIVFNNCNYCGIEPQNYKTYGNRGEKTKFKYSGIDRIDNKVGYVRSNCVPCCKVCNYAKNTLTLEEFYTWLNKAYKHSIERNLATVSPDEPEK